MSGGPEVRRSGHCAKGNHYDCSGHLGCDCECHAEPGPEVPQQLADELDAHRFDFFSTAGGPVHATCACGHWRDDVTKATGRLDGAHDRWRLHVVDALMAHVERIAAERAAEALREAAMTARHQHYTEGWVVPTYVLNDLAEAMAAGRQETT